MPRTPVTSAISNHSHSPHLRSVPAQHPALSIHPPVHVCDSLL